MARTKRTAQILRELDIPAATSSSEDDESVIGTANPPTSADSLLASETQRGGVPNAQNTEDIGASGDDSVAQLQAEEVAEGDEESKEEAAADSQEVTSSHDERGAMEDAKSDEELYVTLKRDDRTHRVDKFNWLGTCEFSSTMKLSCIHAMTYRKHVAKLLTIPYSSITSRWLRFGTVGEELTAVNIPLRISSGSEEIQRKKQMTERDKYKSAQNVLSRITAELTDLPDFKFEATLDTLENWWGNLRQGNAVMADKELNVNVTKCLLKFPRS